MANKRQWAKVHRRARRRLRRGWDPNDVDDELKRELTELHGEPPSKTQVVEFLASTLNHKDWRASESTYRRHVVDPIWDL